MLVRLSIPFIARLLALSFVVACDSAADGGERGDGQTLEREDAGAIPDAGKDAGETDASEAGLANGVVGSTCTEDADCGGVGRCMLSERVTSTPFPGGYCTAECETAADCGERGLCSIRFRGGVGTCYLGCERDEDCARTGYRCRISATSGVGTCLPAPAPLPDGIVGSACSSDEDCGGGAMTCKTTFANGEAPGGYCSQSCAVHADCGESGFCVSGVNGVNLNIGTCYRTCSPPDGCRDGYVCQSFGGSTSEEAGVCTLAPPGS